MYHLMLGRNEHTNENERLVACHGVLYCTCSGPAERVLLVESNVTPQTFLTCPKQLKD